MARAFTVVTPGPAGFRGWDELAEAVEWSLQQLGHEVHRGSTTVPKTQPIYLGWPDAAPEPDAIFYNTEQVGSSGGWQVNHLYNLYRNRQVWDYSETNAARYGSYGLPKPQVVRPGYCPALEGRFPVREKLFDVAFFGSSNERRERILQEVEARGLRLLRVPFGLYGAARDAWLAQAKLCINVHFYESVIFEAVRCSYLALNGMPVLSEASAGEDALAFAMAGEPYEQLAEHAALLCRQIGARESLTVAQSAAIKKISMVDEIGAALESLDHKPVTYVSPTVPESATFPMLTLSMIVKDEATVIERCLASVKPYLKRWCIVDTGSTDGTQDIIRNFMAGIPGSLHECSWKEYDGSRTEALELARGECDQKGWLLFIDADEMLVIDGSLVLPDQYDCYNVWASRCVGCQRWIRATFARANKPWFYELPRHEGLYCRSHAQSAPAPLPNVLILSMTDGKRAKENEYERYLEDARVLEAWAAKHPNHPDLARCQYYIAQSYRDAATGKAPFDRAAMQKAALHYLKRASMGGYPQEVHSALYWAASTMDKVGYPWDQVQQQLLEAYEQRPSRAETIYIIGERYRKAGKYKLAELFLRKAASIPPSTDFFAEVDLSIYEWKAKEELAVTLTWLDQWAEARDLFRQVLKRSDLPTDERQRIEQHFAECLKEAPDPAVNST